MAGAGGVAAFGLQRLLVADDLIGSGRIHQRAEGRDLDDLAQAAILPAAAEHHVHDAKAPADDEGAAEQRLDLFGRRIGRDVEVFRAQAEQQVAHRAADDVGLVAAIDQRLHHLGGALIDQRRIDLVLALRHLDTFAKHRTSVGLLGWLAHQLVEKLLDHVNRFNVGQPRW